MSRRSPFVIVLSVEDRSRLESLVRKQTAERRMVVRANIVLAAADGEQNVDIARRVNGQGDVLAGGHRRSPLVANKSPRVLGVTSSCGPVGEPPALSAGGDDVGVVA
jgi:hypothetical protein